MSKSLESAFPEGRFDQNPVCPSPHFLRFELGGDQPLKSRARVEQAVARATTLFVELFQLTEIGTILVDDFDWSGRQALFSVPEEILSKLVPGYSSANSVPMVFANLDDSPRRQFLERPLLSIDYNTIFRFIAHRELGRFPRINQDLQFMDLEKGIAFYMYDDRGCLISFAHRERKDEMQNWHHEWQVVPNVTIKE